jgi:hypothetical protein
MKKYFVFFVFTTPLLFLLSCDKNNNLITNPSFNILSDSVVVSLSPIDSKIIIKLIEEINPSNRNVALLFYTEEIYSPAGSKIISSFSQVGDTLKIKLKELWISDLGAAIFSPATVKHDLNTLQEGSYILDITINSKKVIGLIKVTKESFELKIQPNNMIHFYNTTLFRIPKTIIWGQSESILPTPYKLFLDSLIILGAKPHNLKGGDYYYFEVDFQGGFNTHSALGMAYGEYFLYNFEGDSLITRSVIKRFAKRYVDSIYIQLFGGRGEMYYSTVLKNEPW